MKGGSKRQPRAITRIGIEDTISADCDRFQLRLCIEDLIETFSDGR